MLLLFACTGPSEDTHGTDPWIELVAPTEGATVCGAPMIIDTSVGNIVLVDPPEDTGAPAEPGTGHIDVMLNGQDAAMIGEEDTQLASVADGVYQVKVELSNADHTPVLPYAGDLAYVTVAAAACGE